MVDLPENLFALPFRDGLHHLFQNVGGGGADQVADGVGGDASGGRGDGLVENRERVAHGAVAGFGQEGESIVVGFDFFARDQVAELGDDGVELYGAETE